MEQEHIPQEVIEVFGLSDITKMTRVGDGMINQTFCVIQEDGNKWIVQSLSDIFDPAVTEDAAAVMRFLHARGWACPAFKEKAQGKLSYAADGKIWRVMSYVEHTPFDTVQITPQFYQDIGALLGRLHADLAQCPYVPQSVLAGFHDQQYYLRKAQQLNWSTCEKNIQTMAHDIQELLASGTTLFDQHQQLIHGDPRRENIFFHEGNIPFLFIDYDTFMVHSLYVDVGDCVRSLCALEKHHSQKVITSFVQGYNSTGGVNITEEKTLQAFRMITLELTLRFLIDSIEDSYFDWDKSQFASRTENNLHHAKKLWNVYCTMA